MPQTLEDTCKTAEKLPVRPARPPHAQTSTSTRPHKPAREEAQRKTAQTGKSKRRRNLVQLQAQWRPFGLFRPCARTNRLPPRLTRAPPCWLSHVRGAGRQCDALALDGTHRHRGLAPPPPPAPAGLCRPPAEPRPRAPAAALLRVLLSELPASRRLDASVRLAAAGTPLRRPGARRRGSSESRPCAAPVAGASQSKAGGPAFTRRVIESDRRVSSPRAAGRRGRGGLFGRVPLAQTAAAGP